MIPPETFFFGRMLAADPAVLRQTLGEWPAWKREVQDSHNFEELFPLNDDYLVWLGEMKEGGVIKQRRRRNLVDPSISLDELLLGVRDKIGIKNRNENLWICRGHEDKQLRAVRNAHGEAVMLSGYVRHVGRKDDDESAEFQLVHIDGPYLHSNPRLNDLACTCRDFAYSNAKRGHSNFQAVCDHIGALIEYVNSNPAAMETYEALKHRFAKEGREIDLFCPFHTDHVREDVLPFFTRENLSQIAPGKQPSLAYLMWDVFFAHYFGGKTCADISEQLLRLPIYDIEMVKHILDGRAVFEVMPNSQLFGVDSTVARPVHELYRNINRQLREEGFELSGYCFEKRNSGHKVIAANYLPNPDHPKDAVGEARVLFSKDYPPVIVRRTPLEGARIYPFREHKTHSHPYSELFLDPNGARRFDDRTRKYTNYTVELPQCYIQDELLVYYAQTIHEYFPGGFDRLVKMAEKNANPRIHLPKKSLVYRMEKMLNSAE